MTFCNLWQFLALSYFSVATGVMLGRVYDVGVIADDLFLYLCYGLVTIAFVAVYKYCSRANN